MMGGPKRVYYGSHEFRVPRPATKVAGISLVKRRIGNCDDRARFEKGSAINDKSICRRFGNEEGRNLERFLRKIWHFLINWDKILAL